MKDNAASFHSNELNSLGIFTIFIIILLEGFVTISVEMLTIRQLVPVVGSSVVITSLIIGIFLLFLALGYYKGGKYKGNFQRILKNNFTITSVFLGVGLSYLFIQWLFYFIFMFFSQYALMALIVYLLLVTAPLVYLLGQTVPITTNLFKQEHHIGTISGKVLCLSTLGSFLGSIITTLVMMNFFGVAWTVVINYVLLALLVILLVTRFRWEWPRLFLLFSLGVLIYVVNVGVENYLFAKTNNYGNYQIIKNFQYPPYKGSTLLSINNSGSSLITQDKKGFDYIELIKRILFQDLNLRDKNILAIGAGGFSLSAESDFGNRFLYIDIDKDIPGIVKKGFADNIHGKFINEDARKFLMHTHKKFDVVVSDTYNSRNAIPFHLLSKEYFQSIKNILQKNGVAIFNIIAVPTLQNAYSKHVDNTLRVVFGNCMAIPLKYSAMPTNIIYVCSPGSENSQDKKSYSDNLNSSTLDFFMQQSS